MIGNIIYNLFITPIEMVIEFIFSIIYKVLSNPGFAIIGVSLAINFLVLPLYKKSDALQDEERAKQAEMKPWLDHIKKHFKGDERYMMTQTYYRQVGYKPIYALRSSISLLLQIPFFIAAYHYLSNLEILQGASFLCFSNLGEPDQLIPFFGELRLNLLPILMTTINIVSGAIYTKGFPLKDKLQLYIIALVFLVLLYNSPAGLVFYWTLNNLFSLGKNFVMKVLPKREKKEKQQPELINKKLFILGGLFMAVFTGLVIPLSVVTSSPTEFITDNYGPIYLVISTFATMIGFFVIWVGIFYYLASNRGKNAITYILWAIIGMSLLNFFFFGRNYGNLNSVLVFDSYPTADTETIVINIVISVIVMSIFCLIVKYFKKISKAIVIILLIASIGLSTLNIVQIIKPVNDTIDYKKASQIDGIEQIIPLSTKGKNVIVFMLDKAIGSYVPSALSESGKAKMFEGFTYYPNTLSYGKYTNFSTPSLFGGYEYTPIEINKRNTETLQEKHNEAVSVLPVIYNNEDYKVTVCDPSYAGDYSWVPDLSIFDGYENINGYITIGAYSFADETYRTVYESQQKRNIVCYSLFKCLPVGLGIEFYNWGNYLSTNKNVGIFKEFLDSFTVLENLVNITKITEDEGTFLFMQNSSTHDAVNLDDNYEVNIEESNIDVSESEKYFDVNVASYRELGTWFEYMKEMGVWDNTRIILCSDHAVSLGDFSEMVDIERNLDVEGYNPLLMVKDFNSKEFSVDDKFMTLADIATLATEGVIEDAVNPFTGKDINTDSKDGEYYVIESKHWNTNIYNGNVFDISDGFFWKVSGDNIFNLKNWEKVD